MLQVGGSEDMRERVYRMYQHYNPDATDVVDDMLRSAVGHEGDVLQALVQVYGPEPGRAGEGTPAAAGTAPTPHRHSLQLQGSDPRFAPWVRTPEARPAQQEGSMRMPSQLLDAQQQPHHHRHRHRRRPADLAVVLPQLGLIRKLSDLRLIAKCFMRLRVCGADRRRGGWPAAWQHPAEAQQQQLGSPQHLPYDGGMMMSAATTGTSGTGPSVVVIHHHHHADGTVTMSNAAPVAHPTASTPHVQPRHSPTRIHIHTAPEGAAAAPQWAPRSPCVTPPDFDPDVGGVPDVEPAEGYSHSRGARRRSSSRGARRRGRRGHHQQRGADAGGARYPSPPGWGGGGGEVYAGGFGAAAPWMVSSPTGGGGGGVRFEPSQVPYRIESYRQPLSIRVDESPRQTQLAPYTKHTARRLNRQEKSEIVDAVVQKLQATTSQRHGQSLR